jgi:hypothetical protein
LIQLACAALLRPKVGTLKPETKAGTIIAWLKDTYGLGHGHSMAVFALLKGRKKEGDA